MKKEVTFKESRIIGTTILLLGTGFLTSAIPKGSIPLFLFNSLLALIAGALFYYFWKTTKHNSKRYFSLLSFVMLNTASIHLAIPLLRIYYLTTTFWVGVIMLTIMLILPYIFSREIAFGIQQPSKSKLGKIYSIYVVLIIGFGTVAYIGSLSISTDMIVLAIFAFLLALFCLFIAPVMLIKPKKMNEIMNE
ncbi:hypothetical protein [Oceanobacillus salinisoli]|uniref:hypothetical protein n=1 Tax=Oceanobacillus salinisoli TaxID=2678611 RepID=UPI0012E1A086|nr:hypothetical protein [Oceanobacillus salinisoli]